MKPRIENLANGVTREVISEQTHLMYDPASKSAVVHFQYRDSMFVNDALIGPASDWSVLTATMEQIATGMFGTGLVDPVTGAKLDNVSGAGVMEIIKSAFPALYDAAVAAENAVVDETPSSGPESSEG